VQISKQILNILLAQFLSIARHFISPHADDVADPIIVCGQAAQRQIFILENALEPGSFLPARGIRLMAATAFGVVYLSSRRLLRIESQLGIGLAAFHIAACGRK